MLRMLAGALLTQCPRRAGLGRMRGGACQDGERSGQAKGVEGLMGSIRAGR